MKELKSHQDYPLYAFTASGRVYSYKTNQWLSTKVTPNGYVQATLRTYDKTVYVHRMVAELFCPAGTGNKVNHKDGDKTNNHATNLEWVTAQETRRHAFDTGLQTMPKGDACWNSKLPAAQYKDICKLRSEGYTHRAIAKVIGCSRSRVGLILEEHGIK